MASDLARALADVVRGEVRFGVAERAVYGQDASNYRQVPRGVVKPADVDDVRAALAVCREFGVPVVARGSGTSIGGQAIGQGAVVLDFRRHLGRVLEVDPDARTARVEPGTVLDELQRAARKFGLRFGPDPSTHSRCTLGGMIGNDACGSHSLAWGRTSDNLHSLDLLLADGTELTATGPLPPAERAALASGHGRLPRLHRELQGLAAGNLPLLRRAMPTLPRRGSGYPLDALLPERGYDLVRAVTGTEGTCALLLGATVRLVPEPPYRALVVAGYPDETAAADAVPALLPFGPLTCEGMAADLVAALLAAGPRPPVLDRLPDGACWLFLETGGDTAAEAADRARGLADAVRRERTATVALVTDPAEQRALWSIREAGAGIVTRLPPASDGTPGGAAWPGWEDSAVPVDQLGSYLRQLRTLLKRHGLRGVPFGHFGEGCVHLRLDFPVRERPQVMREFLTEAADLVVAHGGSLSGEHGDGQARAELLPRMFPPQVIDLFARFKQIWDPENLLNPGLLVDPRPLDADLRFAGRELPLVLAYPQDSGSLLNAVHRCVGVGKCVDTGSGVMCPSYMVTEEERHSTRGRARLLGEMLRGELVTGGWRSPEVREALDLCLGCKGCASDCPVQVDMATYRSEFLYHHYRFRPRPASHYSLGLLPLWLRLAHLAPRAANAALHGRFSGALLKRLGGIDPRRALPALPERRFSSWFRAHRAARPADPAAPAVLLWPDSMSELLDPAPAMAAVQVLEQLGFRVELPSGPVCCGLTRIASGRLDAARRVIRRSLRHLPPGLPVVGLEPSCTATLRGDWPKLLDGPLELLSRVRTLAEFLDEREVALPRLTGEAMTQVHCHQHAVLGTAADRRLTERLGLTNRQLDAGCCGLAGAFGFERGHYEVSVAVAERALLPAVRAAAPGTLLLADGLSCRTQLTQLEPSARPLHLAEVLLRAIGQAGHSPG
ncbi:FAD-binding and (Fe-S)-binding domain-containing protein [Kitasatospora sp. CB01950]|uniref:FAD-binding and (Fe-S)-binding domain-containing protein n=1 Tax=Kitasatospora sp. CB01950 TaxID=1703930 RepID=UPI00093C1BDE|nr:FAD-binding and (Fe-S)-binding domain-containing protein [Kitasatospora sp. CB01950]OKJ13997.1 dimethylmenaquinone methyltransferase [Kitasatospora sp. CB01950]